MRKLKIVEPLETPLRIARVRMNQAFIVDADNSIVIVCYAKYAELIVDAVNAYASRVETISISNRTEER